KAIDLVAVSKVSVSVRVRPPTPPAGMATPLVQQLFQLVDVSRFDQDSFKVARRTPRPRRTGRASSGNLATAALLGAIRTRHADRHEGEDDRPDVHGFFPLWR